MKSAKIATRQRPMTVIPPATASLFRISRRQASRQRLVPRSARLARGSVPTGAAPPGPGSLVSDAGVESAIEEVDGQVHEGEEDAVDEHHCHDHRIVAPRHRE